jgi:hypothetical protein
MHKLLAAAAVGVLAGCAAPSLWGGRAEGLLGFQPSKPVFASIWCGVSGVGLHRYGVRTHAEANRALDRPRRPSRL